MNFIEVLKQNGLTDEVIVKIGAYMKSNKLFLASEENLDVRYNKLKLESETNANELAKSQALITELQKGNKGNDELQNKIKDYEGQIATLKADAEKQRVETALDRALLEANVSDVDYVKFKIKEKGTELKLDDNGQLIGSKDLLDALKVQIPSQFKSTETKITEIKLPKPEDKEPGITKEEFNKMSYQDRLKLFNENKETYDSLVEEK